MVANYFDRLDSDANVFDDTSESQTYTPSSENWHPEMDRDQLSLVFDQGASLNIFLRPSDGISRRVGTETYIENYELKNHIREGSRYASFTDGHHAGETDSIKGLFEGFRSYYCYSNIGPGFFNFTTLPVDKRIKSNTSIMNKVRYAEMAWIVRDDYEKIFDGIQFEKNDAIINAIQAGRNFRITITTMNDLEYRLDVDLLFYYPKSNRCFGNTKSYFIPLSLSQPKRLHEFCLEKFLDANKKFPQELSLAFMEDTVPTLFHFNADGTYQTVVGTALSGKQPYKNVKIFASKTD